MSEKPYTWMEEFAMLELLKDMPDNVVAVRASGQISGKDYEDVLIPAVESSMKRHGKIRVLYELSQDFSGFTAEAMFDDAKLGLRHLNSFEKIAVITDVDWVSRIVRFFSLMIPCPVKVFGNNNVSGAKAWVVE